jgi:formate hydrogenlyase subunit 3/multisubunit Na+/H+ antiporter MnhD subunit
MAPTCRVLLDGTPQSLRWEWDAAHGVFSVELDALSAFFLVPVLGLSMLAAVYGGNYLLAQRRAKSLGSPWLFFNLFVAGMEMVVIARTALLFLVAWELMSVAAYCLVTFEHEKSEVRRAGWVYLIATHLGVAFLLVAFVLLGSRAGSLEFAAFRGMSALGAGWSGMIFVLALIGFGTKAGFVPFHVWLPEAHPAAPSHVSALMSGVMIKMGLYGLLRFATFLGQPAPWWGLTLAGLGLLTALVGMALALQQRDVKRVLAYSSIENIGLIGLALGASWWGWASHQPVLAALGMTAALLHTWNHALMKGMMFLAAGSVLHGTGTKDMEKLGGLTRRMPWTAGVMMVGAVALAALPPLNGFVSKWLLYLSLMKWSLAPNDPRNPAALMAIGLLALVSGLAAITFVRLTGIVLLGAPRSESARHAHESSPWMLAPMLLLALLCLTVAVIPQTVASFLERIPNQVMGPGAGLLPLDASNAPVDALGAINACMTAGVGVALCLFLALSRKSQATGPTWGCGFARPTVRMQYTGRSFAEIMAEHLLPRLLRPRIRSQAPAGLFPGTSDFGSECPDPIARKVYEPFFDRWAKRFSRLRIVQQGKVHIYLVYIVVTVVLAMAWRSVRMWWGTS